MGAERLGFSKDSTLGEGFFFGVRVVVTEGGEAHGHELGKEEEEDGDQGDAFDPTICCDGSGEARVREGGVGWGKKLRTFSQCSMSAKQLRLPRTGKERCLRIGLTNMYECRCDYDPRAKVFRYEESPFRSTDPFMSACVYGKSCSCDTIS